MNSVERDPDRRSSRMAGPAALARLARIAAAASALSLIPSICMAQDTARTATEAVRAVSLQEAVDLAIRAAPAVVQAGGSVRTAESAERSAWGSYLPSLSLSTTASRSSTERFNPQTSTTVTGSQDSYNTGFSANLDLFTGGRRGAQMRSARAQSDAAEAGLVEQRYAIAFAAKQAFFDVLRGDETIRVAELRLKLAEEGLQAADQRLRNGSATRSDVLRAQLERTNARQALAEARNTKRTAGFILGRTIGVAGMVDAEPGADTRPRPIGLTDEALAEMVRSQSPAVRTADATLRSTSATLRAAKAQYFPTISASSGYDWFNQDPTFRDARGSWNVRLGLSYPIFNRFTREDAVTRADVQAELAAAQLRDARLGAEAELERVLGELRLAEERIGLTEEAVTVAQEDLRVQQERYRLGASTILDQVTSQVNLVQAETDRIAARFDYLLARAELEMLAGREL